MVVQILVDAAKFEKFMQRQRDIVSGKIPSTPEERDRAKALTFAERYGMSEGKLRSLHEVGGVMTGRLPKEDKK